MTELQSRLLEIMRYFHSVCVENNIRYYVLGGTCLGAVRHKGFIPWDDDIDVGMPRCDYDRLIAILKKSNHPKYCVEAPGDAPDFVYSYAKLYDATTTLVENTRYRVSRGIYLDLFPLDGAGDSPEDAYRHFKKIERYHYYKNTKVCALNPGRKMYKNLAILAGRCIPECIFGWRWARKKSEELCASRPYDDYAYIGNMYGNWRFREVVPREVFGEPKLYAFEDMQVCGPQDADTYLTTMYGNYMQLPPVEKRVTHHDYVELDLNRPYKK